MNISAIARGQRSDDVCIYGKPILHGQAVSTDFQIPAAAWPENPRTDGALKSWNSDIVRVIWTELYVIGCDTNVPASTSLNAVLL